MFPTASLAVLAAVGALLATPLAVMSDEFDAPTLTGWNLMRGDDFGDGNDHRVTVEDGVLTLVPARSWWVDGHEALYLSKDVTGDFVATMRVRVTGTSTELPQADWTLSGILVRDPASTHERESWVSFRTGEVGGGWVYERKTTRTSRSQLVLSSSHPGWVELRLARVGSRFFLLRRGATGKWLLHWTYSRPDLPPTLQVGIDGFSGDESPHADLVSRVDWFRFAPTGVPARKRNAANAVVAQYLSRG